MPGLRSRQTASAAITPGTIDGAEKRGSRLSADLTLADRVFTCPNGHVVDRDGNAATNLARWPCRATNARRRDGAGQHPRVGETSPKDAGTDVHTAPAA